MNLSFDFVLQIVAISTSLGSLTVLTYLYALKRKKKLLICLLMLLAYTGNYFTGILSFVLQAASRQNIFFYIFISLQLITALLMIELTRNVIESLGHPRVSYFKPLMRILLLLPLVLFITQVFTSGFLLNLFSDLSFFLLGILLWIELLLIKTNSTIDKAVRKSALIGYGIIIPGMLIQTLYSSLLTIRFIDAGSYLFMTISVLVFSVYYLSLKETSSDMVNPGLKLQQQYRLTEREFEVFNLLIQSSSYKEIASILGISMPTVKTHVSNVYRKTETKGRSEIKYRFSPKK